jgi:hypothetical protein
MTAHYALRSAGTTAPRVRVIDLDPEPSGRSRKVAVKMMADRTPVPPARQPFEPVGRSLL